MKSVTWQPVYGSYSLFSYWYIGKPDAFFWWFTRPKVTKPRDRDVISSRPRRDRDVEPSGPRRDLDVRLFQTLETETRSRRAKKVKNVSRQPRDRDVQDRDYIPAPLCLTAYWHISWMCSGSRKRSLAGRFVGSVCDGEFLPLSMQRDLMIVTLFWICHLLPIITITQQTAKCWTYGMAHQCHHCNRTITIAEVPSNSFQGREKRRVQLYFERCMLTQVTKRHT